MEIKQYGALLAWDQFLIQDISESEMEKHEFTLETILETPDLGVFFIPNGHLLIETGKGGVYYECEPETEYRQLLVQFKKGKYPDVGWEVDFINMQSLFGSMAMLLTVWERIHDFIMKGNVHYDFVEMQKAQKKVWMEKSASCPGLAAVTGSGFYPAKSIIFELPKLPDLYHCPKCKGYKFSGTYTVTMDFDRKGTPDIGSVRDIEMHRHSYGLACEMCGYADYDDEFSPPTNTGDGK